MPIRMDNSRILLTGAGSGIGRSLALQLAKKGAILALVGRNEAKLADLAMNIRAAGGKAFPLVFDVSRSSGQNRLFLDVMQSLGGLDILINNAGISGFGEFSRQRPEEIERLVETNITGPLLLTRAVLPHFIQRGSGTIVNIGSTVGAVGFGHFSAYSATKFALRGFSEALRRELDHPGINVTYVAPRATRTSLNPEAVVQLNERMGVTMDEADVVARAIVRAIEQGKRESYIGWSEKLLVKLNGMFPRLVDAALKKNNQVARDLASIPAKAWKSGNVRYYTDFLKNAK
ncbi:MAG: SDR family oxidoreductase [Burkholderiales bacterium]|nr:SDR family oxidoreductase [Burkholderiales bacterium]